MRGGWRRRLGPRGARWPACVAVPARAGAGGRLYRVEQAHTAQAHQPPGGDGMLAVYRPLQEPGEVLPWVYGEAVSIGDRRIDPTDGLVYEVYAEAGANLWEPHTAPAIWRLAEEEEETGW